MNVSSVMMQAARGPVLLITLGILFLLHQNGAISFGQSCPVLLIVYGVMKFLEHWAEKPAAATYYPPEQLR